MHAWASPMPLFSLSTQTRSSSHRRSVPSHGVLFSFSLSIPCPPAATSDAELKRIYAIPPHDTRLPRSPLVAAMHGRHLHGGPSALRLAAAVALVVVLLGCASGAAGGAETITFVKWKYGTAADIETTLFDRALCGRRVRSTWDATTMGVSWTNQVGESASTPPMCRAVALYASDACQGAPYRIFIRPPSPPGQPSTSAW
ncbi:unnamed protein product [Closterium sp. Yama58-4]|nr:unnamed protein product [Closterium sp. Yama58-4]